MGIWPKGRAPAMVAPHSVWGRQPDLTLRKELRNNTTLDFRESQPPRSFPVTWGDQAVFITRSWNAWDLLQVTRDFTNPQSRNGRNLTFRTPNHSAICSLLVLASLEKRLMEACRFFEKAREDIILQMRSPTPLGKGILSAPAFTLRWGKGCAELGIPDFAMYWQRDLESG